MAKDTELPAGFEDLRGRKFQGRYALDELLHASPWRVSFAGREHDPERGIVVELVRPSRLHDQTTLEHLERRVAACKRVRHPVVHGPIDAGELADGKLWLVAERPVGEPLTRHLQRQPLGRLDWMDARPLLLELVRGLGAAHARHVIHGALNPSCCWVDRPDFGVPSLHVLGFGANTSPSTDDTDLAQSRITALAYDAVFMTPETAGGVFGDERSDVYLTGLVAWLMLVGKPPFQAANPFQNAAMHLTAPLPAMRDAGVDVPENVEELLRSMLAKKPAQRIGGMGEIEQVLLGLDDGGEAQDVRESLEPEGARGRRGRARARQAGVASRDDAVQRLSEKDGGGGLGRGATPRLPGHEIVDARRGVEPGLAPVRPRQAPPPPPIASQAPLPPPPGAPQARAVPPMTPQPQYVPLPPLLSSPAAASRPQSLRYTGQGHPSVETTQHLERFAPVAAAPPRVEPPREEHTAMLTSREISEQLWSGQGHDPDEANPDATMMLLLPESAAPPAGAARNTVHIVQQREDQQQLGTPRFGSAPPADRAPPTVPVVTGRTERMSAEDVRMLRLAGLGGSASAPPSPARAPEPPGESTQILEIVQDTDLEEQQTTALSPEQVRALRRAYGKRPEEE